MFEPQRLRSLRQAAALPWDDPCVVDLRRRVASIFGVDESFVEPPRIVRYSRPGDTFELHVDWIVDGSDSQLELLGQRVATALVYLTDVPIGVGGATEFPRLGVSVVPSAGMALLWPNVARSGMPLESTQHVALPLSREGVTKIAANVWVRDRPLPTDPDVLHQLYLS